MNEFSNWRLVVVEGEDLGAVFQLGQKQITVGRGVDDDFCLADVCVTHDQLTIEWSCEKGLHIATLTGDSPTQFNNIPASRNAPVVHELREGDQLQIGGTILRYVRGVE